MYKIIFFFNSLSNSTIASNNLHISMNYFLYLNNNYDFYISVADHSFEGTDFIALFNIV